MAKLIQICASQNDLFGLDGEGGVYQYNFKASAWTRLGDGRGDPGQSPLPERHTATAKPKARITVLPPGG
jgi:hypothetical protein